MDTHDGHGRAADLLLELETRMRAGGLWSPEAPSTEALASDAPFARDTLSLPQWLQFVLVPRLAALIEHGAPLPTECAIRPLAEVEFADASSAAPVLAVLDELDRLLTTGPGGDLSA